MKYAVAPLAILILMTLIYITSCTHPRETKPLYHNVAWEAQCEKVGRHPATGNFYDFSIYRCEIASEKYLIFSGSTGLAALKEGGY